MKIEKAIIMSIKNLLMSIVILSFTILILYTFYMPNNIIVSNILSFIGSLKFWLQPPYLYFIMNFIILAVVASSRFHHNHHHDQYHQHDVIPFRADQYDVVSHLAETVIIGGNRLACNDVVSIKDVEVVENSFNVKDKDHQEEVLMKKIKDESTVIDESTWNNRIRSQPLIRYQVFEELSPEYSSEIPPDSSRFVDHDRRHVEGGKALKVSKPKHDTLENTWKAINEGRNMPYSTTIDQGRSQEIKAKDNITSTMLSKEPSLSQDELNRQVEAFISKFKEQMRLQRQQ
ncbi:unnamed protein product [Amaranthus hypochondriacus]